MKKKPLQLALSAALRPTGGKIQTELILGKDLIPEGPINVVTGGSREANAPNDHALRQA